MEAFRRALSELGLTGRLLAADLAPISAACRLADVALGVPRADSEEYIPALLRIVADHQVGLLVPVTDLDLLDLARHRERFAELGCTVMIASEATIRVCRDKSATAELIRRAGLPEIHTTTLAEFRDRPFYPCFVKPVSGSASIGAARIEGAGELDVHVAKFGPELIVQECAAGQELTIDVYRDRRGVVRSVVPRLRLAVRSGEVEKGVTVADPAVIDATLKLAGVLGDLWGVFCCQCRRDGDDAPPQFFEINPRFGGGAPLSIAAGANLPLYLLQEVLGRDVTAEVGQFTANLVMLRYDQSAFVQLSPEEVADLPGYQTPSFR